MTKRLSIQVAGHQNELGWTNILSIRHRYHLSQIHILQGWQVGAAGLLARFFNENSASLDPSPICLQHVRIWFHDSLVIERVLAQQLYSLLNTQPLISGDGGKADILQLAEEVKRFVRSGAFQIPLSDGRVRDLRQSLAINTPRFLTNLARDRYLFPMIGWYLENFFSRPLISLLQGLVW